MMHESFAKVFTNIYNSESIVEATKNIIFPIHKKCDLVDPSTYRGLPFMNCVLKAMMFIMNNLYKNRFDFRRHTL